MTEPSAVLVLPDSPSVGPVIDLLRLLSHQRLIRPFSWASADTEQLTSISNGEVVQQSLAECLRSETPEFTLVRLVTADGVTDVESQRVALELESAIGNALATRSDGVVQVLRCVNILAPAAREGSVPTGLHLEGEYGRWSNVLLMPEVQRRADLAVAPVGSNHEYVAHAVCGMITVAGLWWDAELNSNIVRPNNASDEWHLVRTRSRVLHAPELPDIVIGRVAQGPLSLPHGDQLDFERVPADRVSNLLDELHRAVVRQHHLDAVMPSGPSKPVKQRLTIRQFLRLVRDFLTLRLPRRVRSEISGTAAALQRLANERLNSMVGTGDLNFEINVSRGSAQSESEGGTSAAPDFLLGSPNLAEPAFWSDLRKISFGLLDGGPLPDVIDRLVASGSTRLVLGQRDLIVGSTEAGPIDVAATAALMKDGQSVAFLDRIVVQIAAARESALEIRDGISKRLEALTSGEKVEPDEPARRGMFRSILRWVWRAIKVVLVVGVCAGAGILLPFLLPLGAIALVLWLVFGGFLALATILAALGRMLTRWFREAHAQRPGSADIVLLNMALRFAELQLRRFEFLQRQIPDWHRIIQIMVHEPFGAPLLNSKPRIRHADLHLPPSHAIREGETDLLRREGVIASVRRSRFRVGWLNALYWQAHELAKNEFQLRQPGLVYDPDGDRSGADSDGPSSRRTLREAIAFGRARALERVRLAIEVHNMLATGAGLPPRGDEELVDWLFSEQESGKWSAFLAESVVGVPANWNASFIRHITGAQRSSDKVERWIETGFVKYVAPQPPSTERLLAGAETEFRPFNFRSWVIEGSHNVPASELTFFDDHPTPVELDLTTARSLWSIPDLIDEGEVELLDAATRAGWGIPEAALPPLGSEIKPLALTLPPQTKGEYAFLTEIDGEPLTLASNVMKYRIRREAAPPNALEIVQHCLQLTSDAIGVTFVFDGLVEDLQSVSSNKDVVSIAWAFDEEYRVYEVRCGFKAGSTIGLGGPSMARGTDGRPLLAGGSAVLNSDMALTTEIRSSPSHAVVLLHELGHAMNLGHVTSSKEIMCPGVTRESLDTWGPGDRRGLDCARFRPLNR